VEARRLYVATWGSPLNWRPVVYRCRGGERPGFSSIVCAEADRYVVYALDSALTAAARSGEVDGRMLEAARSSGLEVAEEGGRIAVRPAEGEGWREALRRYMRAVAGAMGREVEVVATGSRGLYGGYLYEAAPDHILAELVLGLWRQVEALGEPGGTLEMALDVIHGVNFMPTISLYAARLLAGAALLRGYDRVEISVWNATPQEWSYEALFVDSVDHLQFFWTPRLPAARALYYGAPLHYAALCREAEEPDYRAEPKPVCGEGPCRVVYGGKPDYRALYERLLARAGCRDLPAALGQYRQWHVVRKLNPTARLLVQHELDDIRRRLDRRRPSGCATLADLKDMAPSRAGEPCGEDNRDFVAHAGLLDSYTKVCRHGDDYAIQIDERTYRCLEK
jgi:CRISPR-associated protein Csx1